MLKRIAVEDLRTGMYVQELCGSWMEHPFWRTQFRLEHADDLARLRAGGIRQVWIDTARGLDVASASATGETCEQADLEVEAALNRVAVAEPPIAPPALHDEIVRARPAGPRAASGRISTFNEARLGCAVDVQGAEALVDRIRASVTRSPAAFVSVARLKRADENTFMHSVAVSGLMIALARQLGMSDAQVSEAGLAGLLHDIGKARIPDAIPNKPAQLNDDEFMKTRQHPRTGHGMLRGQPDVQPAVLDAVLHHHERIDAHGYPNALPETSIAFLAPMCAICDVYDAITSARVYKPGWDPAEAIRKMAEWSRSHFDSAIFQAFVRTVGIYPIGSLVRMTSGRRGAVVDQRGGGLLTPTVKVFFSTRSQLRIAPEVIDLAPPGAADHVVGREDPEQWRFTELDQLWLAP